MHDEQLLKRIKHLAILAHRARRNLLLQAKRRQQSGGFADVPLDRMQAVAAVGDVRRPDVFAGRQQIRHAYRQQRAQRNLKRQRRDVDVVVAAGAGVQIDPVIADADAI